jgi:hypothetical protein
VKRHEVSDRGASMMVGQRAVNVFAHSFRLFAASSQCSLVSVLLLIAVGAPSLGVAAPQTSSAAATDATCSRAARDEAVRNIPWRQMSPANRQAAQAVIENASIYRRLPTRVIDCDPDLFTFLIKHPEVVIDVWRVMGISQVALTKSPDGSYRGTDGAGTTGTVRYLFSHWSEDAHNVAVVFADGSYTGAPFVTPLKAQSVMLVRSGAVREQNGRSYITVRIDSFVRVENLGLEIVAKTVQPWISKTADQNLIETLTFVSNFSHTAEKNPQGMQRLTTRLATVDQPTRNELVELCFRTAERYAQRDRDQSTRTSGIVDVRPPLAINRR